MHVSKHMPQTKKNPHVTPHVKVWERSVHKYKSFLAAWAVPLNLLNKTVKKYCVRRCLVCLYITQTFVNLVTQMRC